MPCPAGRYAPSPTGDLHLGSLFAALGSYLQARAQGAPWRIRIDDLDAARAVAGADRNILDTLDRFGLRWDGPVLYQSTRTAAYRQAIDRLRRYGYAFDCGCTRRQARLGPPGIEGPIYPGTCRDGLGPGRTARTVRLQVPDRTLVCNDAIQGAYRQNLARDIGDFIVLRADGVAAYQLATVLDDSQQQVGEVVRGADLLACSPRQMFLHQALGLPVPAYGHLPLLVDSEGKKLGKSTGALTLQTRSPSRLVWRCLDLLGQQPPDALNGVGVDAILRWAIDNWALRRVPSRRILTLDAEPV